MLCIFFSPVNHRRELCRYNFDWWATKTQPWTQRKTLSTLIDCADEKKIVPKIRKLEEFDIFKHLDLQYSRTKFYQCNVD